MSIVLGSHQYGKAETHLVRITRDSPRHEIVDFPGYVLSYDSVALHLALVASGYACACVTARHYVHDVAGAAKLLENAGAELRQLNGAPPPWQELITHPNQRSPDAFFACPQGAFERLAGYVRAR